MPDACDTPAASAVLEITDDATLDTSIDTNCNGGVLVPLVPQFNGPEICVVRYGTITIAPAATLRIVGSRALALAGDGDVSIRGTLDLSAQGTIDGPGAGVGRPGSGGLGGGVGSVGGGGGGNALMGASGGTSSVQGGAANAGESLRSVAFLVAGGRGGPVSANAGDQSGGGGGGAGTVASCRGTVLVEGRIAANGGGGTGGEDPSTNFPPRGSVGAGGGAGGNLVLQGVQVIISGRLFANGGGGGAGCTFLGGSACDGGAGGENGKNAVVVANGGLPGPITNGRQGGVGGSSALQGGVPVGGGSPLSGTGGGGGGGGSIGIIKVLVPPGVEAVIAPIEQSPLIDPVETALLR